MVHFNMIETIILCFWVFYHNNKNRHLEHLGDFFHYIHGESEKASPQRVNDEAIEQREIWILRTEKGGFSFSSKSGFSRHEVHMYFQPWTSTRILNSLSPIQQFEWVTAPKDP